MERSARLLRRNLILAGLACVFLAVLLLRPSRNATIRSETDFPAAFADFDPDKARAVELERKVKRDGKEVPERIRLTGSGDTWRLATSHDYPAMTSRVRTFLEGVKAARVKREPTQNPDRFAQYAGTDGFTDVRILGDADTPLATFGIGTTNADNVWSDAFLRIDTQASPGHPTAGKPSSRIVVVSGFDASGSRADVASWGEQRIWPALARSEVFALDVEQPSKTRTIELVRGKKAEGESDDPWTMKKPEEGKTDASAVGNLLRAFVGLNLADVVDHASGAEADAKYGFDKPDVVVTAKGTPGGAPANAPADAPTTPTWKIVVGKKAEGTEVDRYYVRRFANGKEDPFVFAVSDFDLKDFRAEPATLLEKKPEPPAPTPGMEDAPPGMEGAAMDAPAPPAMEGETPPAPPTPEPGMDAPGAGMDTPAPGMETPEPGMEAPPPAPSEPPPPPPTPGMR